MFRKDVLIFLALFCFTRRFSCFYPFLGRLSFRKKFIFRRVNAFSNRRTALFLPTKVGRHRCYVAQTSKISSACNMCSERMVQCARIQPLSLSAYIVCNHAECKASGHAVARDNRVRLASINLCFSLVCMWKVLFFPLGGVQPLAYATCL